MPTQIHRRDSLPFLFLDFDGVLHPTNASPGERFCRMGLVEEYLAGLRVAIVISSSWRFHFPEHGLKRHFPASLREKIAGFTGDAYIGKHARWNEIRAYAGPKGLIHWRALDDSAFEFPSPCKELLWCDGARGVQESQLDMLKGWLGEFDG